MKRSYIMIAALALGLFAAGCVFTSGQIRIFFDLDNFKTSTNSGLTAEDIDLSTESEYKDNKDKLKDLVDVAVLGEITNTGGNDINVEVWMTPSVPVPSYTDPAQLKADGTALKVWGPFSLKAGETKKIDWDKSAALFNAAGKAALLKEAKGDGTFTIYALAAEGTYSFDVAHGVLVLVMDVGI
jgi:hypothetical protein